ncbi:anion permease [Chloroflexota bacterium]
MPDPSLLILFLVIVLAVGFGLVNGFNDAANAIAPAIGTRALSPKRAIMIAAVSNFLGAATGTAVARTIGKGILVPEAITTTTVIAALCAVITWGIIATSLGLPISLTHGFIAGMAAAGIAVGGLEAVTWSVMAKVVTAIFSAPMAGFLGGFVGMAAVYWIFNRAAPDRMRRVFSKLQIPAVAFVAYAHGKNDGQMPIGIITIGLVIYYQDATIWDRLSALSPEFWWISVISALAISSGMAIGGWKVIRTIGMRVTTLRPTQGFMAQASAAGAIEIASNLGIPVSTTHCISSSIIGVGSTQRFSAVRWGIAGNIVTAWVLTFPICGGLGYFFAWLLKGVF